MLEIRKKIEWKSWKKKVNNLQEAWKLCKNILLEAQINVCQTSKRPAA